MSGWGWSCSCWRNRLSSVRLAAPSWVTSRQWEQLLADTPSTQMSTDAWGMSCCSCSWRACSKGSPGLSPSGIIPTVLALARGPLATSCRVASAGLWSSASKGPGSSCCSSSRLKSRPLRRSTARAAALPRARPASRPRARLRAGLGAMGASWSVGAEISSQGWEARA